jgi:NADPH:quinone reductase-like Zn-dependent oxidoreductase
LAQSFFCQYPASREQSEDLRQVWVRKAGGPDMLEVREAADPIPRAGQVRIQVAAAGVNFADILGRMGFPYGGPKIPFVPGMEVSGRVQAVGQGVSGIMEGDLVMALTPQDGYSDLVCVAHQHVYRQLEWMNHQDAAAIPVNYVTAYLTLVVMAGLREGDRVLVHNAAGGMGLAAVDVCRIVGAEIYGTASPGKHDFLSERGVHYPIDYQRWDYERVVAYLTDGAGVDVILDPLGGSHWRKNYRLLRPCGRLVYFGASSAAPRKRFAPLSLLRTLAGLTFFTPLRLMRDNKAVMGFDLRRLWAEPALLQRGITALLGWYDEALFRPEIDRTFKLDQAPAAHHYLQDRKNIGKVLLVP